MPRIDHISSLRGDVVRSAKEEREPRSTVQGNPLFTVTSGS